VWGWLIAAAVVARVIYVAAMKSDRPRVVDPPHPSPAVKKPGLLTIIPIFFGVALALYGFFGLLQGEPGVFVIAVVLLGLGWLLVKNI
jgi:hypothetical protein